MNDSSGRNGSNALAIIKRFASSRKSKYILSVIFALLGVICSIIPYYLMSRIVVKLLDGVSDWDAYQGYFIWMIVLWTLRTFLHSVSCVQSQAFKKRTDSGCDKNGLIIRSTNENSALRSAAAGAPS